MGNSKRCSLIIIIGALFLAVLGVSASTQKITIEAEKLEYSLTGKITDCYGTEQKPVRITSGEWELTGQFARWDEGAGVVLLEGEVNAIQKGAETLRLKCHQLRFWPQKEELEAQGSVIMESGELRAVAGAAKGNTQQIVLTQNPSFTRGTDLMQGSEITVFFSPEEKILVKQAQFEVEAQEE